jgi:hypothetical protein
MTRIPHPAPRRPSLARHVHPRRGTTPRLLSSKTDASIPDDLAPDFASCVSTLEQLGLSSADADKAVRQAFGWGTQLYWRQELVQAAPDPEAVDRALEYMERRLHLETDADKAEVVKKFPEVLMLSSAVMEDNVGKLEDRFKIKGKMLANSLKRKPRVLGATTDCLGDCAGDCTRCWQAS